MAFLQWLMDTTTDLTRYNWEIIKAPFIHFYCPWWAYLTTPTGHKVRTDLELIGEMLITWLNLATCLSMCNIQETLAKWKKLRDYYTLIFMMKFVLCISWLIVIRGCIPRYRYDFLTKIGWVKFLGYVLGFFIYTVWSFLYW